MRTAIVTLALCLGLPAFAAERPRIALMEIADRSSGRLEHDPRLDVLTAAIAGEIRRIGTHEVITQADVEAMAKQLETAGARDHKLDAEYLLSGWVEREGSTIAINLKLISIKKARISSRVFRKLQGDEQALLGALPGFVESLLTGGDPESPMPGSGSGVRAAAAASGRPAWIEKPEQPGKLCAAARARSDNPGVVVKKAVHKARSELMREFGTTVETVVSKTYADVKNDLTGKMKKQKYVRTITRILTDGFLVGSDVEENWVDPKTGMGHALVCMDIEAVRRTIKANMQRKLTGQGTFKKARAEQVLKKLTAAVDAEVK